MVKSDLTAFLTQNGMHVVENPHTWYATRGNDVFFIDPRTGDYCYKPASPLETVVQEVDWKKEMVPPLRAEEVTVYQRQSQLGFVSNVWRAVNALATLTNITLSTVTTLGIIAALGGKEYLPNDLHLDIAYHSFYTGLPLVFASALISRFTDVNFRGAQKTYETYCKEQNEQFWPTVLRREKALAAVTQPTPF